MSLSSRGEKRQQHANFGSSRRDNGTRVKNKSVVGSPIGLIAIVIGAMIISSEFKKK